MSTFPRELATFGDQGGACLKPLGMRAPIVIGAMVAALLVLVAGQTFYTSQRVDRPLRDAISRVPGVESVEVDSSQATVVLDVALARVPNLMETYQAIERAARGELADRPYRVNLADRRTKALTDAYYALNAVLEEGIATGRFTDMVARVQEQAQELGLSEAKVYIDAGRVYVQLAAGGGYLYETLPRAAPAEGGTTK